MAKIEQFSRLINHRITGSGTQFTIPTSNDHTDETWLNTDLYIGEIGINVTDDKIFMRTNNGIVQIATGTSSGSTASTSAIFVFNSPNIQIGSTYSADGLTPRSGYFTDLGASSFRWKDLYLGGSSAGYTTINVNNGVYLREASNGILTTEGIASSNAPIEIFTNSSNANKDRVLWLNTRSGQSNGSTNYITSISSQTVTTTNNSFVLAAAGNNISFDDGVSYVSHIGKGFNRPVYESDMHVVGGKHAIKGVADDGSGQYDKSEWITSQAILRTTDALTTDIVTIPWSSTASGGDVIQVKAYILGTEIDVPDEVFSAEIMGCFTFTDLLTPFQVGTPILNVISSFSGTQPDCEMDADGTGLRIKVTGTGTQTIQWLCTYSYHRLINIL